MSRCLRCRSKTHSRRRIALRDFTTTGRQHQEGAICEDCWAVVTGEDVEKAVAGGIER